MKFKWRPTWRLTSVAEWQGGRLLSTWRKERCRRCQQELVNLKPLGHPMLLCQYLDSRLSHWPWTDTPVPVTSTQHQKANIARVKGQHSMSLFPVIAASTLSAFPWLQNTKLHIHLPFLPFASPFCANSLGPSPSPNLTLSLCFKCSW